MSFTNLPKMSDCNSGSRVKNQYVRVEDRLVKTGEMNVYDYIQSFREQTDYTAMLEKMAKGDPVASAQAAAALSGEQPLSFGVENDRDLRDVYNAVQESKKVFDSLGGFKKLGVTFKQFLSGDLEYSSNVPDPVPAPSNASAGGKIE